VALTLPFVGRPKILGRSLPSLAVVLLCLALLSTVRALTDAHPKVATKTPLDKIRSIDRYLSELDVQLQQIETLVAKATSGSLATTTGRRSHQPWTALSRALLRTTRSLRRTSAGLRNRFRHTKAGRKLFPPLLKRSTGLEGAAGTLVKAHTPAEAQEALSKIKKARTSFVMSYQSIASDSGALHCERGLWSCCEVVLKSGEPSCHWSCVTTARKCRAGLLGSRSQSASSDVMKH
jgi:hypothetical protein